MAFFWLAQQPPPVPCILQEDFGQDGRNLTGFPKPLNPKIERARQWPECTCFPWQHDFAALAVQQEDFFP